MAHEHDFTKSVKKESWQRQGGRCACCGGDLMKKANEQQELWGNHHVVPKQAGGNQNSGDPWMKSKDNSVYLCHECHHRVHEDGKYRDGIVAGPESFPYSHGDPNNPGAKAKHVAWSKEVNGKWDARQEAHRSRQR